EVKAQYPGCLLLFRMGDFNEMFFDDAKRASSILNIALTHRGKHMSDDIPMCGIPVAALENYLGRLVRSGCKVAICDQMEDPKEAKKRGYKAIVKRDVTRVITPGTIIEDSLLNFRSNNFLMVVVPEIVKKTASIKNISFATIDISTGDFFVNTVIKEDFSGIIGIYQPKEFLLPAYLEHGEFEHFITSISSSDITYLPDTKFNPIIEKERLEKYFKVKTLESFGISVGNEIAACGALLEYLLITQRSEMPTLPAPKKILFSDYLIIDSATSKSLEIVSSSNGEYSYSLLGALDNTKTFFGARTLASRVATPIIAIDKIQKRMDCTEFFVKNDQLCESVRNLLSKSVDYERSLSRIKFNKFSPKNVGDIRELLRMLDSLKSISEGIELPTEGEYSFSKIKNFLDLKNTLEKALIEYSELPALNKRDYGIIATGYSKKLDELKYLKDHSKQLISNLQAKYIDETKINTLKIKNNAILGWYVEIPLSQKGKITSRFIHRQTLVGDVRYTTDELIALQTKLIDVVEEWNNVEQGLYNEIVQQIIESYDDLLYAIKCLAYLDLYTNFAYISKERGYIRPTITEEPVLEIENGKHPILSLYEKDFTCNNCDLDTAHRIALLTGPNMAGKSTYLRQNALLVIMAQIGCYVPATRAKIGVVDRLFSRIGASDDLARGRSTFMVEMIETATILNQATEKSFVILDEVGRGTSTYDGLSIAWAVIENLYKINKCRVLFATHYRELTALQDTLRNIRCKTLKVQEWEGEVVFYHKIIDGIADKSYGIHVASIAGVPKNVIKRAKDLLKKFENNDMNNLHTSMMDSLFDFEEENQQKNISINEDPKITELKTRIAKININSITPMQAMNILFEIKNDFDS
ncbi:MAG: DNA mismatch repair protein MutS, partial [Alphaproteobacteria bacterium]|nr:DNA mismatch repair protein MutS [Alphaproteobacteria bacterium]